MTATRHNPAPFPLDERNPQISGFCLKWEKLQLDDSKVLWNQLPPSVREADTVTSFKSRLNTFLKTMTELIVRAESGSAGPEMLL